MDYYKKVIGIADHVLIYFGTDKDLIKTLDKKYQSYNNVSEERHQYWKEVRGRIFRNSFFSEYERTLKLESEYFKDIGTYVDVESLLRSPVKMQFVTALPLYYEYANEILSYQVSNQFLRGRMTAPDIMKQNLDSLRFFNDIYNKSKTPSDLFPYLTLFKFAIEALVANKMLRPEFYPFLKETVIPLFRAQRYVLLTFLELMDKEQEYIDKGMADDVMTFTVNKDSEDGFEKEISVAEIFTRYYQTDEPFRVSIPPLPASEDDVDIYLCPFSKSLLRLMDESDTFEREWSKRLDKDWHRNPLANLDRIRMLANKAGVREEFVPYVNGKLIARVFLDLEAHMKLYSVDSLIGNVTLPILRQLHEWEKATNARKVTIEVIVNKFYRIMCKELEGLVDKNLIQALDMHNTIEAVKQQFRDAGYN